MSITSWIKKTILLTAILSASYEAYARIQQLGPYDVKMMEYEFYQEDGQPFYVVVDEHKYFGCNPDYLYRQTKLNATTIFMEIVKTPNAMLECSNKTDMVVGGLLAVPEDQKKGSEHYLRLLVKDSTGESKLSQLNFTINIDQGHTVDFTEIGEVGFVQTKLLDSIGDSFKVKLVVDWSKVSDCYYLQSETKDLSFTYFPGGQKIETQDRMYILDAAINPNSSDCQGTEVIYEDSIDALTHPSFRKLSIYVPTKDIPAEAIKIVYN